MNRRALNRREQRRLDDIAVHLGVEAPELVSMLKEPDPEPPDPITRLSLASLGVLGAAIGTLATAPWLTFVGMACATLSLLAPRRRVRHAAPDRGWAERS
ncbi:DUF3040 domain-containing protein [Actinokineospora inagensis]|uniref:DUF3040 domain-containing protein n=1 Tax=Actinokineospora inagensis TaxID=103730 RepID=UPI000428C88C|nr:DUF3040 domain-containing protein [Actinokineospora inagensis]